MNLIFGVQGPLRVHELSNKYSVKIKIEDVAASSMVEAPTVKLSVVGNADGVREVIKTVVHLLNNPSYTFNQYQGMGMGLGLGMNSGLGLMYGQAIPNSSNYSYDHNVYSNSNGQLPIAPYSLPASTMSNGYVLALGSDGQAGHLSPVKVQPDGSHQQIADIKNEVLSKFLGNQSSNLTLIKNKSGASIQIMKCLDPAKANYYTSFALTGLPQYVTLASQMVQEILVNGASRLIQMPDAVAAPILTNNIRGNFSSNAQQSQFVYQQPVQQQQYMQQQFQVFI
jgi:hypothetical protein